jgi:ADP-heptose:LPS heptosyltransferase
VSCLILKNDGLGDLILASGIISEIGRFFEGQVDLVTCEQNREVAENIIGIRECLYLSRDKLKLKRSWTGLYTPEKMLPADEQTLQTIRSRKYDVAICMKRFIRQSTLIVMNKVRAKSKYVAWQFPTNVEISTVKRYSKGWIAFEKEKQELSETTYFQKFVETVLQTKISSTPRLRCTEEAHSKPEPQTIGLGIGGASSRWMPEEWLGLVKSLKEDGYKILLFGGAEASSLSTKLESEFTGIENFVGKLSFGETVPQLQRVVAYIGNDTGLSHFASLVVPKCLIILGGGTFRRFFPWPGSANQSVIYHGLDCFDCDWRCKFPTRLCLTSIRHGDVFEWVKEILKTGRMHHRNTNLEPHEYEIAWKRRLESLGKAEAKVPQSC